MSGTDTCERRAGHRTGQKNGCRPAELWPVWCAGEQALLTTGVLCWAKRPGSMLLPHCHLMWTPQGGALQMDACTQRSVHSAPAPCRHTCSMYVGMGPSGSSGSLHSAPPIPQAANVSSLLSSHFTRSPHGLKWLQEPLLVSTTPSKAALKSK